LPWKGKRKSQKRICVSSSLLPLRFLVLFSVAVTVEVTLRYFIFWCLFLSKQIQRA
jgi:hypothetical protein